MITCKELIDILKDFPPEACVGMWSLASDRWSNITTVTARFDGYGYFPILTDDDVCDEEDKDTNVERYQAVHDELWKLKTQALNFNDEETGIVVSRLCSIMQEILADIAKERNDNND